ncbi:hypothetical protein LINGRAHAP2_LOCUS20804 [Linum grandiflorum]
MNLYCKHVKYYVKQAKYYVKQVKYYVKQAKYYVKQAKYYTELVNCYIKLVKYYVKQAKYYVKQNCGQGRVGSLLSDGQWYYNSFGFHLLQFESKKDTPRIQKATKAPDGGNDSEFS